MTRYCEESCVPADECVGCIERSKLDSARSFYVHRFARDGHEGWTGSLRPISRALREAQAWIDCGWTAEVVPNNSATRAQVRAWERAARERRAS